jgi:hypothetical protein
MCYTFINGFASESVKTLKFSRILYGIPICYYAIRLNASWAAALTPLSPKHEREDLNDEPIQLNN